jgi:class 3 adenylate cyclase
MLPDSSSTPFASLDDWRKQGERLLASGAPIMAYDTLAEGLTKFPGDVRLRQLLALALARSGASGTAIPILESLRAEGHADEETLGLQARVFKDLAAQADTAAERHRHLESAFASYHEAHRLTGGTWTGINAATTALLLGRKAEAAALAQGVRDHCLREEQKSPDAGRQYWHVATLAEAYLILGDGPAAEQTYARAAAMGSARPADTASTRRNARLILGALGQDAAAIDRVLRVPRVAAFAGHLIDTPDRRTPRFPPVAEAAAAAAIRDRLNALDVGFGFSAAACGADILFLEALGDRKGETTIILPYDADQFERDSVDIVPGADWPARYRLALASARDVFLASDQRIAAGEMAYEYAVLLIEGLAGLRADELDTDLIRLVLWDRKEAGGRGGTAPTVERWGRGNQHVDVIDLEQVMRDAALPVQVTTPAAPAPASAPAPAATFEPDIVAMLFADAKGFSGLREDQIPAFVEHFLGTVARVMSAQQASPMLKNTWGDGLYFVFASVRDAGVFALDLMDAIAGTDWTAYGLPAALVLRTGLHAGPAYACLDPVTGRQNYFGAHVSRAARIEPITPPGQVYASAAFAAIARADDVREFRGEYVGRTPLAKHYGTLPMFVVRRRYAQRPA